METATNIYLLLVSKRAVQRLRPAIVIGSSGGDDDHAAQRGVASGHELPQHLCEWSPPMHEHKSISVFSLKCTVIYTYYICTFEADEAVDAAERERVVGPEQLQPPLLHLPAAACRRRGVSGDDRRDVVAGVRGHDGGRREGAVRAPRSTSTRPTPSPPGGCWMTTAAASAVWQLPMPGTLGILWGRSR